MSRPNLRVVKVGGSLFESLAEVAARVQVREAQVVGDARMNDEAFPHDGVECDGVDLLRRYAEEEHPSLDSCERGGEIELLCLVAGGFHAEIRHHAACDGGGLRDRAFSTAGSALSFTPSASQRDAMSEKTS